MDEVDTDSVFVVQVLCQMFGTIDGTMLTAGTAERDLEVGEVAFDEALDMMVHQTIDGLQEREDLAVLFEEIDDGLVESGEGLVFVVLTGIMGSAAVEDIATAITGLIYGQALLKREGVNRY